MDTRESRQPAGEFSYRESLASAQKQDSDGKAEVRQLLEEEFLSLQEELRKTEKYLAALCEGDYTVEVPEENGRLTGSLQILGERLRLMQEQIRKQEKNLRWKSCVIFSYNELLRALSKRRNEWVFVVDEETRETVYCNKRRQKLQEDVVSCQKCGHCVPFREVLENWSGEQQYQTWERQENGREIYQITTFPIEWQGRSAWAHLVRDITDEKKEKSNLKNKAYHDPLTGVYNRLFFMERLEQMVSDGEEFLLAYLDLDDLKWINDSFGHNEGDHYIMEFVRAIGKVFRNTDVFARIGGDEFCIILKECELEVAEQKMQMALDMFADSNSRYRCSFSYGLLKAGGEDGVPAGSKEELLRMADNAMYECKSRHRALYEEARSMADVPPDRLLSAAAGEENIS